MALAQSTSRRDWFALELVVFGDAAREARGLACLLSDDVLYPLVLVRRDGTFDLQGDPLAGKVKWTVRASRSCAVLRNFG